MKRKWWAAACFLVSTAGFALAQSQDGGDEPRERRPGRERGGFGGPPPGRPGGDWQRGMVDRIAEELQLDDAQYARLEELMAAQRDQMDKMFQEMREARESGDETRMQEIRARFGEGRGPGGMFGAVFEDLRKDLRPDQIEKLDEMRENMSNRMRGGDRLDQRAFDRLSEELKLDEQQQQQFDEIVAEFIKGEGDRDARMRELRPLFDEMRQAREDGDEAKMAELRAKFEEARASGEHGRDEVFSQIETILTPEQKETLAKFRDRGERRGRDRDRQDPRDLVRAARRLELSDEQSQRLDEIEKQLSEARRDVNPRDREAVTKLFEDTKADIHELLEPQQVEEFDRALERSRDRGRRQPPR